MGKNRWTMVGPRLVYKDVGNAPGKCQSELGNKG